uniref:tyrosine-type recombinase/integrase n=1 Tax=Streptomyces rhizosphaerihabitans TaxID=1266770 RepID=UPI0028F7488B|nr:tyrosine-type recombinase/integrase [Streptomyces rhizosphaerihabitans]
MPKGRPLDPTNLTRRFRRRLLRSAGLRTIRFHDLRHSTATLLLEQGGDLVVIKELLGHAHIGVYAHVRLRLQRRPSTHLATPSARPTPTAAVRWPLPSAAAVAPHESPARTHLTGLHTRAESLSADLAVNYCRHGRQALHCKSFQRDTCRQFASTRDSPRAECGRFQSPRIESITAMASY